MNAAYIGIPALLVLLAAVGFMVRRRKKRARAAEKDDTIIFSPMHLTPSHSEVIEMAKHTANTKQFAIVSAPNVSSIEMNETSSNPTRLSIKPASVQQRSNSFRSQHHHLEIYNDSQKIRTKRIKKSMKPVMSRQLLSPSIVLPNEVRDDSS